MSAEKIRYQISAERILEHFDPIDHLDADEIEKFCDKESYEYLSHEFFLDNEVTICKGERVAVAIENTEKIFNEDQKCGILLYKDKEQKCRSLKIGKKDANVIQLLSCTIIDGVYGIIRLIPILPHSYDGQSSNLQAIKEHSFFFGTSSVVASQLKADDTNVYLIRPSISNIPLSTLCTKLTVNFAIVFHFNSMVIVASDETKNKIYIYFSAFADQYLTDEADDKLEFNSSKTIPKAAIDGSFISAFYQQKGEIALFTIFSNGGKNFLLKFPRSGKYTIRELPSFSFDDKTNVRCALFPPYFVFSNGPQLIAYGPNLTRPQRIKLDGKPEAIWPTEKGLIVSFGEKISLFNHRLFKMSAEKYTNLGNIFNLGTFIGQPTTNGDETILAIEYGGRFSLLHKKTDGVLLYIRPPVCSGKVIFNQLSMIMIIHELMIQLEDQSELILTCKVDINPNSAEEKISYVDPVANPSLVLTIPSECLAMLKKDIWAFIYAVSFNQADVEISGTNAITIKYGTKCNPTVEIRWICAMFLVLRDYKPEEYESIINYQYVDYNKEKGDNQIYNFDEKGMCETAMENLRKFQNGTSEAK